MKAAKILIVDDEEGFAEMTKLFLEAEEEYQVEYESDSRRAMERAREFKPDLVLLDIVMPHLDGGDVQSRFSQDIDLKRIPILFLTSMVSEQDTPGDPFIRSGGQVMLPKTTPPEKLKVCIKYKLDGRI